MFLARNLKTRHNLQCKTNDATHPHFIRHSADMGWIWHTKRKRIKQFCLKIQMKFRWIFWDVEKDETARQTLARMVSAWATGHQRAEQFHRQDQSLELSAICQRFTSHPRRKAKSQKYRELARLSYRKNFPSWNASVQKSILTSMNRLNTIVWGVTTVVPYVFGEHGFKIADWVVEDNFR